MAARSAEEIRAQITIRGRYGVRSWDCVCLLRLDDRTLEELDRITTECVAQSMNFTAITELRPQNVSMHQLHLFLLAIHPLRWKGLGNTRPAGVKGENQVAYVMRTQGIRSDEAMAFIRDPVRAERKRA